MTPEARTQQARPSKSRNQGARKAPQKSRKPHEGDALDDLRREVARINERLDELAEQLEATVPSASAPIAPTPIQDADDPSPFGSFQSLRVLAMRMAVSGVPRRRAERRLRGAGSYDELKQILDEAYGHRAGH